MDPPIDVSPPPPPQLDPIVDFQISFVLHPGFNPTRSDGSLDGVTEAIVVLGAPSCCGYMGGGSLSCFVTVLGGGGRPTAPHRLSQRFREPASPLWLQSVDQGTREHVP